MVQDAGGPAGRADDDDRYDPYHEWGLVRVGAGFFAILLAVVCGGGLCVGLGVRLVDQHQNNPALRVAVVAGAILLCVVLVWGVLGALRNLWRDLRVSVLGERVVALVETDESYQEHGGDWVYRVLVSGRTQAGRTFHKWVASPVGKPGARVEIRYDWRTRQAAAREPVIYFLIRATLLAGFVGVVGLGLGWTAWRVI